MTWHKDMKVAKTAKDHAIMFTSSDSLIHLELKSSLQLIACKLSFAYKEQEGAESCPQRPGMNQSQGFQLTVRNMFPSSLLPLSFFSHVVSDDR